ncbi:Universal stress protein [Sulfidibacter corallicola]|uniref:Universal stress protein n=1 Tax=Sulfidibacter corallicola TaxID=2818388 RepID=A0A8A4TEE6_SULCO|nr:universal stress protein [Sulfidibacter corallicola]QTD47993.1 universal stress protein [Sulfidibacter corallicola]
MSSIGRILFPTDFSESSEAAAVEAFAIAGLQNAEIHLLHINLLFENDPHQFPSNATHPPKDISPATEKKFEVLIEKHGSGNLDITQAEIRSIAAGSAIVEYARDHDFDLIVMGTHGRRGLRHWMLGSTAEETVKTAHCPVLTVRNRRSEGNPAHFERILVPTDFSAGADETVRYARIAAAKSEGELLLLHVIPAPTIPDLYGWPINPTDNHYDKATTESHKHLDRLMAEEGPQIKFETHVTRGNPHRQIVAFAKEHEASIILMPHRGADSIFDHFIGSTTERVLRSAECPVLTLPLP